MPRTRKTTAPSNHVTTSHTVPEAEWPYRVPENWRWVRLSQIIDMGKEKTDNFSDDSIRYIGLENMEKDVGIVSYGCASDVKSLKNVFKAGNVLYGKLRPYLNKHGIAPFDGICSTDILVLDTKSRTSADYVNYYLNLQYFIQYAVANSKGINLPRVSADIILKAAFPLPPLAEQQRIVDRIESLFAKLDEAREKAQAVVDGFENRKAAILHKAFTGELTKKWREERGIGMKSWEFYKYSELGNSKLGKMLDKAKNDGQPIRYLRNVNVRWFDFDLTDVYTMLATDEEVNNLEVRDGDMFICEGGEPGRCAIWHGDCQRMIFQKALHRFRPNNKVISDYLCYYLYYLSHNGSLEKYYTGTTIKHLTGKALAEIEVFVPDITEQRIIIKSITNIFAQERRARDLAESVIAQIDGMKKAILARAFRGELGTNVPGEAVCEV